MDKERSKLRVVVKDGIVIEASKVNLNTPSDQPSPSEEETRVYKKCGV